MHDKSRRLFLCLSHIFQHSIKSPQAPLRECFLALSLRKRQCPVAVNPLLVIWVSGKFLIILILKQAKIALCQFLNNQRPHIRIDNASRLKASLHRTSIDLVHPGICPAFQKFYALSAQRLVCPSDIPLPSIALGDGMADQIDFHHPLILVPIPQDTRQTSFAFAASFVHTLPAASRYSRKKASAGTIP